MGVCEMCGSDGALMRAVVEGTELHVCANCGKFGKVLQRPQSVKVEKIVKPEIVERIVGGFGTRIREARESQGLTQKEFALKLNEKESLIQKWESESQAPQVSTGRKLEKILKIRLVEADSEDAAQAQKKGSGPLTIGDLMKKK